MEITALGMIETSGLLSAIEAADAGLKAAEVRLLGTDYVRGGLVMVRFEGEVAAVQAAVDAGTTAAKRIGNVVSSHVIPRAMPEVFCMLASDVGEGPGKLRNSGCAECGGCEGGMRELRAIRKMEAEAAEKAEHEPKQKPEHKTEHEPVQTAKAEPAAKTGHTKKTEHVKKPVAKTVPKKETSETHLPSQLPSADELKKWKVVALRSFVRKLPGFEMNANDIRYANKEQLLAALKNYQK